MNQFISIVILLIAIVGTAFFVFLCRQVLGLRKSNRIEVIGWLSVTETERNVFYGHPFTGKWYRNWVRFTYIYRVDGKDYSVSGGTPGQRKDLPMRTTVCVQKNAPANAFIPRFQKAPSIWVLVYLFLGLLLLYTTAVGVWLL